MEELSEEAKQNKPKKPAPALFRFRAAKINDLPEGQRTAKNAKELWDAADEETREEYENEYKKEYEQYKVDIEEWKKKYHVEKVPRSSKSKAKKGETEKSKGTAKN